MTDLNADPKGLLGVLGPFEFDEQPIKTANKKMLSPFMSLSFLLFWKIWNFYILGYIEYFNIIDLMMSDWFAVDQFETGPARDWMGEFIRCGAFKILPFHIR